MAEIRYEENIINKYYSKDGKLIGTTRLHTPKSYKNRLQFAKCATEKKLSNNQISDISSIIENSSFDSYNALIKISEKFEEYCKQESE